MVDVKNLNLHFSIQARHKTQDSRFEISNIISRLMSKEMGNILSQCVHHSQEEENETKDDQKSGGVKLPPVDVRSKMLALYLAAERGNYNLCRSLLEECPAIVDCPQIYDPNSKVDLTYTALMRASHHGHTDIVRLLVLVDKGANLNIIHHRFRASALFYAAWKGQIEIVRILCEAGADVNIGDDGSFPLITAIEEDHLEIGRILMAHGSRVQFNMTNKQLGQTEIVALIEAVKHDRKEFVNLLVQEFKVDIDMPLLSKNAENALLRATTRGNLEMVKLLHQNGADINYIDNDGNSALMLTIMNYLGKNQRKIFYYLFENGADIDRENENGQTALSLAAHAGLVEVVNLLLDENVNIDHIEVGGDSPLMAAISHGHEDVAKVLLDRGAQTDWINDCDDTALTIAAHVNAFDIAKDLIKTASDDELIQFLRITEKQKDLNDVYEVLVEEAEGFIRTPFWVILSYFDLDDIKPMLERLSDENEHCKEAVETTIRRRAMGFDRYHLGDPDRYRNMIGYFDSDIFLMMQMMRH